MIMMFPTFYGRVTKLKFIDDALDIVPKSQQAINDDMAFNLAWYSGDQEKLTDVYNVEKRQYFWSRVARKPIPAYHVPLAAAISQLSSDYLFGEETKFLFNGEASETLKAQQMGLNNLMNDIEMDSLLTEAGEIASAAGGVIFKIIVDGGLANRPIVVLVKPDDAIITFKHGVVTNVRYVHKLDEADGSHLWLIEDYNERGEIVSMIHEGTNGGNMTKERPDLLESYGIEPLFVTGYNGVASIYIPNRRPNRQFLNSGHGASDYQGVRQMFDSLDETYSSWINDIRLAKGRIHIPVTFIERDEAGNALFDMDESVYKQLGGAAAFGDSGTADKLAITQFAIRSDDFYKACMFIIQNAISIVGYSTQSFGFAGETSQTATESNNKERKSYLTTSKKRRHFERGLKELIRAMIAVSNRYFNGGFDESLPLTIEFGDAIESDVNSLATVIEMMNRAQAMSIETKVRYFNPSWSDAEVKNEVERIKQESGLVTGSFNSFVDENGGV